MEFPNYLVVRAQEGDIDAYGQLVGATQRMVYALAYGILRDSMLAEDAAQETYLRAFRRLGDLEEPAAFIGWLRRIVITVSMNMRRTRRISFLRLDDVLDVPVLDEKETSWSDLQRQRLAAALLTLTNEERRLCNRRYHGRWSMARLAEDVGVDETVIRKRLERIREKLRKEMEVTEQRGIPPTGIRPELPAKMVELLARPQLTDLPENPVGKTLDLLRAVYKEFEEFTVPEVIDLTAAQETISNDALYLDLANFTGWTIRRILRYDLTLPLLLTVRCKKQPLRIWTAGKVYRVCHSDATHLEAFHQAEVLWIDERVKIDPWHVAGEILKSVDLIMPGSTVRIIPTQYPMCSQAWELEVERDSQWSEVVAWGVFTEKVVSHLGGDPNRFTALGVGYGLERLAMLRYNIDDIRKIDVASVA